MDVIERVQLQMGRLILGARPKTASDAIRGELGLWTMAARRDLALLRWWGKVVIMSPARLCHQIYRYRREHMKENHNGWCRSVRKLLKELDMEMFG